MITFSTTSVGVLQVVGTLAETSFCVGSVNVLFFSFLTVLLNNSVVFCLVLFYAIFCSIFFCEGLEVSYSETGQMASSRKLSSFSMHNSPFPPFCSTTFSSIPTYPPYQVRLVYY